MLIDLAILAVLVAAVAVGFFKGALQPLLVELLFGGTLLILWRGRDGFAGLISRVLHINAVFAVVVALILAVVLAYAGARLGGLVRRMPVVQGADGFFGVFVQALVAVLASYVVVSGLVALDAAFRPTLTAPTLTSAQVQAMERELGASPLTSWLTGGPDFARLTAEAKTPAGAKISETARLNQVRTVYLDLLQPQLHGSRLSRPVLGFGQHWPGLGHVGPKDLPPSPGPSPRPAAASPKPH
ncbi:MAG: hypothetical protein M3024_08470 [Candidatus Dormibacteraeota bacterium]|nr:hypothetical protein [Candidatus Dormibacteraeota bacterium]